MRWPLLPPLLLAAPPCASSGGGDELSRQLSLLEFRHRGRVAATQRFGYLPACMNHQGNASFAPCSPMTGGTECVGGYRYEVTGGREATPPLGMRSANALGGFGTGFFNLMADGEVKNWQLDNSATGATAITPAKPEMLLAVRVNGRAATLRTHPPTPEDASAPLPGVQALTYSASHPVTRLAVEDPHFGSLNLTLYAFTPFQMWNVSASAVPSVAFTLVAENPSPSAVQLDFMVSSPTFSERGIGRLCTPVGNCADECEAAPSTRATTAGSAKECKRKCGQDGECASWSLNGTRCTLSSAIERTVAQAEGMWSGTAGRWIRSTDPRSGAPVLVARRPALENAAGVNYDAGDLAFTVDMAGATGASSGTADDLSDLWRRFASHGRVDAGDDADTDTGEVRAQGGWTVRNGTDLPAHNLGNPSPQLAKNVSLADALATCEAACVAIGSSCRGLVFVTALLDGPRCAFKAMVTQPSIKRTGTVAVFRGGEPSPAPPAPPPQPQPPPLPLPPGMSNPDGHGAVTVSTTVGAASTASSSIVMAWNYPSRQEDRCTGDKPQTVGNHYSTLYPNASATATEMATSLPARLAPILDWNGLWTHNSLDGLLQDYLVNQFSAWKVAGLWLQHGHARSCTASAKLGAPGCWEAYENPDDMNDIDPPHVVHYHSMLRATFFPQLSVSLIANVYSAAMAADGYLPEYPGGDGAAMAERQPEVGSSASAGSGTGRDMSGAASVFIIDVAQVFQQTNDTAFLEAMWPSVVKGVGWQLQRAFEYGIPAHLQSTYDSWELDTQDFTSYSGHLHIAALKAARKLALLRGEAALAQRCSEGIANATATMRQRLWRSTAAGSGYYRAWWNSNETEITALLSGSLYGAVWSFLLGEGPTTDPAKMRAHLASEREYNLGPYGIMTGKCSRSLCVFFRASKKRLHRLQYAERMEEQGLPAAR